MRRELKWSGKVCNMLEKWRYNYTDSDSTHENNRIEGQEMRSEEGERCYYWCIDKQGSKWNENWGQHKFTSYFSPSRGAKEAEKKGKRTNNLLRICQKAG